MKENSSLSSFYSKIKINFQSPLWIIFVINLLVYIPIILFFNQFYSDDYVIFSNISRNPGYPISINPDERFFLFLRPISYFSFWLDFHLYGNNPIPMKIFSFVLHLVFLLYTFKLIETFSIWFWGKVNYKVLIFLMILLSVHRDSNIWVYWISNRTELLYILFYVIAIYNIMLFIQKDQIRYLVGYSIFFILSILSKQQGSHLPVFVIFFLWIMRKNIPNTIRKKVIITSIYLISLVIVLSVFNYLLYQDSIPWEANFWKKPFSLIGILLHSFLPGVSNYIYIYFLYHKGIAVFILALITIIILFLVIKLKFKLNIKIFYFLLSVLIIFYPRILAVGANKKLKFSFLFFSGLIIIYSVTMFTECINLNQQIIKANREVQDFNSNYGSMLDDVISIGGFQSYYMNEYLFFLNNHKFGKYPNFQMPLLVYNVYYNKIYNEKVISCEENDNYILVRSNNQYVFLTINSTLPEKKDLFKINILEQGPRGFQTARIKIGKNQSKSKCIVFYDGLNWTKIF